MNDTETTASDQQAMCDAYQERARRFLAPCVALTDPRVPPMQVRVTGGRRGPFCLFVPRILGCETDLGLPVFGVKAEGGVCVTFFDGADLDRYLGVILRYAYDHLKALDELSRSHLGRMAAQRAELSAMLETLAA